MVAEPNAKESVQQRERLLRLACGQAMLDATMSGIVFTAKFGREHLIVGIGKPEIEDQECDCEADRCNHNGAI